MDDTIYALSSGSPPAAIAIVRVSGPQAGAVIKTLAGRMPEPRRASVATLRDGEGALLDQALVLWFPGPNSATGDDCLELHCHGGRAVVRAVEAAIAIDFDALAGGFLLPDEADPVWAGDIDRMFVSLVPGGYDASDAPLPASEEAWVELTRIRCEGAGKRIAIGEVIVPEHDLRIASGYDDSYHLTPERLLRNALHLGYRGHIVHYVGMSHYFRLEAIYGGYYVTYVGGMLNVACAAWHRDFADARNRLREWVSTSGTKLDRDRPTRLTTWPGEEPAESGRETEIEDRNVRVGTGA